MKKIILFLTMVLSYPACNVPSNYEKPYEYSGTTSVPRGMPSKPGACYAKCVMPDTYSVVEEQLFLFTGDPENTEVEIETIEVVVSNGGKEWVKKKADKNCLSANPDDCLVWCLVDVPREVENYIVVVDTSSTDQYESFLRQDKELISKGGGFEWKEVVCQGKMSKGMITQVQKILTERKGYFGDIDGIMDNGLIEALVNFQAANQLAQGQLTLETLDVLGVSY